MDFSSVYWGMTNYGYNSRAITEVLLIGKKMIHWRAHHNGSILIWPIIGLKPYCALLCIKIKIRYHKRIYLMRSVRRFTCGTITWTSISPSDGSHILKTPCHFGPETTLAQGLCLCLGSPGHLVTSITQYVAGCRVFYLGWNWLKGNTDQSSW